jgi:hypothetical protein
MNDKLTTGVSLMRRIASIEVLHFDELKGDSNHDSPTDQRNTSDQLDATSLEGAQSYSPPRPHASSLPHTLVHVGRNNCRVAEV